mgnify:CR=1 FL=1
MKILFTGKSKLDYNRVLVLKAGLKKVDNTEVIEFKLKKGDASNLKQLQDLDKKVDFIYIPPMRHSDVSYVKKHTSSPVVFDPLISKYLTKADYGHFWKLPIKYFLDKIPFDRADILLTDTKAHREYFIKKFNLSPNKVKPLYIGADTQVFTRQNHVEDKREKFTVGFYGSFIPLQGTDKIVKTAQCLESYPDIIFEMIGSGPTLKNAKKMVKEYKLSNINFHGKVSYEKLASRINNFDLCLGIFGDSKKTDMVIPNKVYHYAAIGKCIVTKNTAGIKEVFTNNKNIALCINSPKEIANQILALKENASYRNELGKEAGKTLHNQYNELSIAKKFLAILENYKRH